jgi:heme-degrading monooxygenase HmoA
VAILREWRAEVRKTDSSEYIDYIRTTGLADYRKTPGNMGAMIAVREIDEERTEVITLSLWSSWDAIRSFAGEPPDQARYYPQDDRFLLTRPDKVKHYEAFGELTNSAA